MTKKNKQFKPMLAGTCEDTSKLSFPLLASPKLDGIRCVVRNGRALTRSLKPVPNLAIRKFLEDRANVLDGCDGELMIDDVSFQEITSMVMSPNKEPHPEWYFAVFDFHYDLQSDTSPFEFRAQLAARIVKECNSGHVIFLPQQNIISESDLLNYEHDMLALGFEGVMLRDPEGLYKYGRSTAREGALLKLKRFTDDEAMIVDVVELQHNTNEAFTGELGQTKRSTAKAGQVAGGTLGALVVEHKDFGRFEIGTGFTEQQRAELWVRWSEGTLYGRLAKFKYFAVGVKDRPRHPVFLGLRDTKDL